MRISHITKTLLAGLLCSSFAFAGFRDDHRMAFSVDPIAWTSGNFDLQFEMSLNDRLSFNAPIGFGFDKALFKNSYKGSYFNPEFGFKYYVAGKSVSQGFYVNPLVGIFIGKLNGATDTTGAFTYDFRVGYSWNMWNGFWMDSFLGYEGVATKFNSDDSKAAIYLEKNWNVGMFLGYAW